MTTHQWINLKPEQFQQLVDQCPIAYLPLGTLEWHGYHMPLGSDGMQAEGLFKLLAEKVGGVVMPMLSVGPDRHHIVDGEDYYGMDNYRENRLVKYPTQKLPGSCYYLEQDLFDQLLLSICKNVARQGFKVLVAHGHGPSTKRFLALRKQIEETTGLTLVNPYDYIASNTTLAFQDDHAAANETSIMMAFYPDLVDLNRLQNEADLKAMIGRSPIEYASEEFGKEIIEANVEVLSQQLKKILQVK